MTDLDIVRDLVDRDHGLAVVTVARDDWTVGASVVNAGVLSHPVDGVPVVGFVSAARARRLDLVRAGRAVTVTFRAGWKWASVEGPAELIGPDDPHGPAEAAPQLLRDIFTAAGGVHDDWPAYDRAMSEERRVAVLIRPRRIYSNPGGFRAQVTAEAPGFEP